MGGTIHLDETYDSGVPGCPGVRFVIDLKKPPIDLEADSSPLSTHDKIFENGCGYQCPTELSSPSKTSLPDKISVLFVDDDPILRKLFARTVKTVAPEWVIREASSGEAALRLVESNHFDVIFCDMYMASVEKSLLGTETVELMRRKGVKSRISGLSANDKEKEFLEAGADCFTFKPFPCERDALISELRRVLYQRENE
jgi:CheY-like chemotaxis protein